MFAWRTVPDLVALADMCTALPSFTDVTQGPGNVIAPSERAPNASPN
jgi:hypothetical protein